VVNMLVNDWKNLFDIVAFPKFIGKMIQRHGCSVFSFDTCDRYCFLTDEFKKCMIKLPFYVKALVWVYDGLNKAKTIFSK